MIDTVAYCRVSTEEQARDDRASMQQQREACLALATRLGRQVSTWFEDPGASGGTAKRPGFQAMMAFCRAHPRPRNAPPGLVLALNASRWGRFPIRNEAHWWMFELERIGWDLRFAEGDESNDPTSRHVTRSLGTGISADYREAIRANARRGWRSTAGKGFWQTEAPIGYRRQAIASDGRTRVLDLGQRKSDDERVKLTPGPGEEVRLVRWLFRTYAAGEMSLRLLAREAYRRHPAKKWSHVVVRALLRNPVYVGDVVWGRRPNAQEGARQEIASDPSTWVTTKDAHPALITRALFAQVQDRIAHNRTLPRLSAAAYPLSGILTCAHCSDHLVGGGGPRGPAGDEHRYHFYRHATRDPRPHEAANPCPAVRTVLMRRTIEPAVLEQFTKAIASPRVQKAIGRAWDRAIARLAGRPERQGVELEKRRAKLLAERDRLCNLAGKGTLAEDEIAPRISGIRAELAAIDTEAKSTRFTGRRLQTLEQERDRVIARAATFAATAASANGGMLQQLLRPWIQSAVVDRIRNVLTLTIQPANLLVLEGRQGPDDLEQKPEPLAVLRIAIPASPSLRRRLA